MSFKKLIRNLKRAFQEQDPVLVRSLLFSNLGLFNQTVNSNLLGVIVYHASSCSNERVMEHFVNFLKVGAKDDPKKQLLIAVFEGKVATAESILKKGVRLEDFQNKEYYLPALYNAVFRKNNSRKDMLTLLLKYGLSTDYRNNKGENLIHLFINDYVEENDADAVQIAEILVDAGVSVHETANNGWSAIWYAITTNDYHLVSFFIDKGVDLNSRNSVCATLPLDLAIVCNHIEIVDLMVSRGADINAKDQDGWTALHAACSNGHEEIIQLFLRKGADITAEDNDGETPMYQLDREYDCYGRIMMIMSKEFAKLSFENVPFSDKDMNLIKAHQWARETYYQSISELERMNSTKFYEHYSYYFVLKKLISVKRTRLTNNEEFVSNFEASVTQFPIFENDLRQILRDAMQIRDQLEIVNDRLKSIFGDYLPDLVLRNLAQNLTVKDLPL